MSKFSNQFDFIDFVIVMPAFWHVLSYATAPSPSPSVTQAHHQAVGSFGPFQFESRK